MKPDQMSPEQLRKFLAYYRKRIDEDPTNVEARLRLATVFREMGKAPRAVEQYEEAAQLLDEQGLALEAIEACKAILELDASRVEAQYFLARLYAQTPDATDESARVARPIDSDDEGVAHELSQEADPRREDYIQTDEFRPEDRDGSLPERPDPDTIDETGEGDSTRVADYAEMPEDSDVSNELEASQRDPGPTIELTPEEQERRDGFSREEMEELLTTIDVDSEDIVDVEDLEQYELEEDFEEDRAVDPEESADIELGAEFEVDESSDADPGG